MSDMMRRVLWLLALLATPALCADAPLRVAGEGRGAALKDVAVEGGTLYRLTFRAGTTGALAQQRPTWQVIMSDDRGRVPVDGLLAAPWQMISQKETREYAHCFYAPAGVVTLVLFFHNHGQSALVVEDVKLTKRADGNLFPGAESFAGNLDYSGWNEVSKASIVEVDGKWKLRVEPGGYALTDPVPVKPGDYLIRGRKPLCAAFFYDTDMRRIETQRSVGAKITVPSGAAYVRLFFSASEIEGLSISPAPEKRK